MTTITRTNVDNCNYVYEALDDAFYDFACSMRSADISLSSFATLDELHKAFTDWLSVADECSFRDEDGNITGDPTRIGVKLDYDGVVHPALFSLDSAELQEMWDDYLSRECE